MVSIDLLRARREDEVLQRKLHEALRGVHKGKRDFLPHPTISYKSSKHAHHLRRVKHRGHAAVKSTTPKNDVVRWNDLYGLFGNVPGAGKMSKDGVMVYPTQKQGAVIMSPFAKWSRSLMSGEYPASQDFYDRITHVQE
jgi:hypothetical protein